MSSQPLAFSFQLLAARETRDVDSPAKFAEKTAARSRISSILKPGS
jgi:hypothetical protein